MGRRALIVPFLPLLLLSAKQVNYVADCLKDAGGEGHFARVETVDWAFAIARPSEKGVVTWRGRQRMKRFGTDFLIREDLETPEGVWTIFVGSESWVQKDGFLVMDKTVFDERVADARARSFWALAPFSFLEMASKGDYVGSAYFESRLVRRVRVEPGESKGPLPFSPPWVLQLDPDTSRLRGIAFGEGGERLLFEDHTLRQNLLNIPERWTTFNGAGQRMAVLQVRGVVYNSYLDENVFTASAHATQGEYPQ
jgi:hypothetical protein